MLVTPRGAVGDVRYFLFEFRSRVPVHVKADAYPCVVGLKLI